MDLDMIHTWFQHGLITRDSLVQRRESPRWVRLSEAVDLSRWRSSRRDRRTLRGRRAGRLRRRARTARRATGRSGGCTSRRRCSCCWRRPLSSCLSAPTSCGPSWMTLPGCRSASSRSSSGWHLRVAGRSAVASCGSCACWPSRRRFPSAACSLARGMRAEALLALASAVVLALGFVLLLASRWSALTASAALLVVALGAAGTVRFARAEAGTALDVGAWASSERRLTDPEIGLDLALPAGWVALKPVKPVGPGDPGDPRGAGPGARLRLRVPALRSRLRRVSSRSSTTSTR